MITYSALITGLSGLVLTANETAFLSRTRPCGIILFSRNCETGDQIRALVASAIAAIGTADILVLIDQEGGRVQRLRPPLARALPPAANYAHLYETNPQHATRAAFDAARLVADELRALSINTNCAPVVDLPVEGSHTIIGDRAYGASVAQVTMLAEAVARGHMAGGVLPVIKHIPGHGRAMADSHHDLPIVATSHAELSATDFAPFRELAHLPAAMTAHVVYSAIDANHPATSSTTVIGGVIRAEMGFDGLLMSDDLSMNALSGTITTRAQSAIVAGCDVVLHCNGDLTEMIEAAEGVPALAGTSLGRFQAALAVTRICEPFDKTTALANLAIARDVIFKAPMPTPIDS